MKQMKLVSTLILAGLLLSIAGMAQDIKLKSPD